MGFKDIAKNFTPKFKSYALYEREGLFSKSESHLIIYLNNYIIFII